jgi:hypothetical protein
MMLATLRGPAVQSTTRTSNYRVPALRARGRDIVERGFADRRAAIGDPPERAQIAKESWRCRAIRDVQVHHCCAVRTFAVVQLFHGFDYRFDHFAVGWDLTQLTVLRPE